VVKPRALAQAAPKSPFRNKLPRENFYGTSLWYLTSGRKRVVPLSVKSSRCHFQLFHFLNWYFDPFCVRVHVEIGLDGQAFAGFGIGNEIDDHFMAF
jgi:hypothetical protein